MTTGQGLWVGANALQPVDARLAMAGLLATNSADPFDVRTGVLFAGVSTLVTGTAGLSVNVAPLQFVSSKGSSNGPYVATNKTTTAVTVPAAPSLGNKRVDLVWVAQQDSTATISADASTVVVFGVVTGTATSGTPSKPALPAGATEVGTVTWDSSSTVAAATNAAQCTLATTCPWTASRGAPIPVRSGTERAALTAFAGMSVIRLDAAARRETYDGTGWLTEVYGMEQVVTTNASGEWSFATGLTTIKSFQAYNGNGGLVRTGNRQNITLARNSTTSAYVGGTATGIAFAADTHAGLASVAVAIDWTAKGYS